MGTDSTLKEKAGEDLGSLGSEILTASRKDVDERVTQHHRASSPTCITLSARKRIKTGKMRESEEQHAGLGAARSLEVKGENSRRRPRNEELGQVCDEAMGSAGSTSTAAGSRATKIQKGAQPPDGMRTSLSVEDLLSEAPTVPAEGRDSEPSASDGKKQGDKAQTQLESEAEEAWDAAAALMELFSRADDRRPPARGSAQRRDSEGGMLPPAPINTPRSNPQTPRNKGGSRGASPARRGASNVLAERALALSSADFAGGGSKKSPRGGGKDDRESSVDSCAGLSPRTGGVADAEGKHNKYCHFCQHIKVKKARSMRACTRPECARRFCEHCLSVHMSEPLDFADGAEDDWLCPICRKVCCCAVQSCNKSHRHCKAYRYRQRRAELAAKRGPASASTSAANTPRGLVSSSAVSQAPALSSLRATLEANLLAAASSAAAECGLNDVLRGDVKPESPSQMASAAGGVLFKAAAAAVAAAGAAAATVASAGLSPGNGMELKSEMASGCELESRGMVSNITSVDRCKSDDADESGSDDNKKSRGSCSASDNN